MPFQRNSFRDRSTQSVDMRLPWGNVSPSNTTFLRLKDPSFCSKNSGCYDTNNFPGANGLIPPFTVQLGIRFQF